MTASVGVVRNPTEAFAKGGNSNECKRLDITSAHFSIQMIPHQAFYFYCQLSLFIGDFSHNPFNDAGNNHKETAGHKFHTLVDGDDILPGRDE
jgi:hypothetical protein